MCGLSRHNLWLTCGLGINKNFLGGVGVGLGAYMLKGLFLVPKVA